MTLDQLRQLLGNARGRATYVSAAEFSPDELSKLIADGILKATNRFPSRVKCPCGNGHLADVIVTRTPAGERHFAACDGYARMEDYPLEREQIRLYKVNPRMLPMSSVEGGKGGSVRSQSSSREQRLNNERRLTQQLHDAAFQLLGLPPKDRPAAMRVFAKGKHWAAVTGIRQGSIGEIIDLKGNMASRGMKPNDVAQLYYHICSNDEYFRLFEAIEKSKTAPREKLSVDEHSRRLKNELERRGDNV